MKEEEEEEGEEGEEEEARGGRKRRRRGKSRRRRERRRKTKGEVAYSSGDDVQDPRHQGCEVSGDSGQRWQGLGHPLEGAPAGCSDEGSPWPGQRGRAICCGQGPQETLVRALRAGAQACNQLPRGSPQSWSLLRAAVIRRCHKPPDLLQTLLAARAGSTWGQEPAPGRLSWGRVPGCEGLGQPRCLGLCGGRGPVGPGRGPQMGCMCIHI